MGRAVYYFDNTRDYTFTEKSDVGGTCVLEFRASGKDMGLLRAPRALISSRRGGLQFAVVRVSILPGPLVNKRLAVRVETTRLV